MVTNWAAGISKTALTHQEVVDIMQANGEKLRAVIMAAIDHLPSPSLILLIGKVDWLFAVHTGLFLRDAAGNGHFFHASSKSGAVLDDDLAAYLDGSTRHLGFSAYRIEKPDAR